MKWDKVVISVFQDQNAGIQAMKAGQLMLLSSDPLTANSNAASLPPTLRIVSEPVGWTGLILSDRNGEGPQPYLKDVRVRQAINYALDRKLMSQALFGKFAEPTAQLQARGFVGYDAKLEERYPYDPAKAKELLAAAGYPNGFELTVAYVNNSMSQFLQQAVGAQLRKVGITVKGMEAQHFGVMRSMADNKAFSATVLNSNSGIPNLAKFQVLDSKGGFNYYSSTDDTLDQADGRSLEPAGRQGRGRLEEGVWPCRGDRVARAGCGDPCRLFCLEHHQDAADRPIGRDRSDRRRTRKLSFPGESHDHRETATRSRPR